MITIAESGKTKYGVQEGFVINRADLDNIDVTKIGEGSQYVDLTTKDVYILAKVDGEKVWKTL